MNHLKLFGIGVFFLPIYLSAQISAPQSTLTPDGIPDSAEWSAIPIQAIISRGMIENSSVQIAWDNQHLFVKISGNLESQFLFPEVLLDVNYDKSNAWQSDDHWFHISATDCHSQAVYGDYSNCEPQATQWFGGPNMAPGGINVEEVEFAIPWSFLNHTPSIGDTVGFSMVVTNTSTEWNMWPTSADRDHPDSWGYLYLASSLNIEEDESLSTIRYSRIHSNLVEVQNVPMNSTWKLIDLTGKTLQSGVLTNSSTLSLEIQIDQIRILQISFEGSVHSIKVL